MLGATTIQEKKKQSNQRETIKQPTRQTDRKINTQNEGRRAMRGRGRWFVYQSLLTEEEGVSCYICERSRIGDGMGDEGELFINHLWRKRRVSILWVKSIPQKPPPSPSLAFDSTSLLLPQQLLH